MLYSPPDGPCTMTDLFFRNISKDTVGMSDKPAKICASRADDWLYNRYVVKRTVVSVPKVPVIAGEPLYRSVEAQNREACGIIQRQRSNFADADQRISKCVVLGAYITIWQ